MIFRRVKAHIEKENWFAVSVDFFIVVVGVFIGIQVANWNESLADLEREREYKGRLVSDFQSIESRLSDNITEFDKMVDDILLVRTAIKEKQEFIEKEEVLFRAALKNIDSSAIPAWQSATYVEMLSAGNLSLIQDSQLKKMLAEYDQHTELTHKGWEVLVNNQFSTISPNIRKYIEYSLSNNVVQKRVTDAYTVSGFDYQSMLVDNDFIVALSSLLRSHLNNRAFQKKQLSLATDVLRHLNIEVHE